MTTLYWCPNTRAVRAMWMLEELGIDYEMKLIDIRNAEDRKNPEFRAASPMGKVPALVDGEVKMYDGAAIGLYLADKYPAAGLAPSVDDPRRGAYLTWMVFTPGVIEPAMAERFAGWETSRYTHGWGDFDTMIETFEAGLADGPWLLGETFSAADVMAGSSANFMKQFGILPDSKVLNAYIDRCLERPAYQRTLEMNAKAAAE